MTCFFLHSCNELVTQSMYNHFCKTKKRYLKCDIYIGNLDKKRPSAWSHSSEKTQEVKA